MFINKLILTHVRPVEFWIRDVLLDKHDFIRVTIGLSSGEFKSQKIK